MSAHSVTKGQGPHCRMWMGVINNFTDDDIQSLQNLSVVELVVGRELAPTTGTPHLHVYIRFEKPQYMSALKKIHETAHWEPARNRAKSIEYCKKGGDVVIEKLLSVEKKELASAISLMQSEGLAGVARDLPYQYVLHSRGLRDLQYSLLDDVAKPPPKVSWYYGSTGVGKSWKAIGEVVNQDNIYIQSGPNAPRASMWWDGYTGQSRVVLDDFRPWWCPFSFLLRLLDRYPLRV